MPNRSKTGFKTKTEYKTGPNAKLDPELYIANLNLLKVTNIPGCKTGTDVKRSECKTGSGCNTMPRYKPRKRYKELNQI